MRPAKTLTILGVYSRATNEIKHVLTQAPLIIDSSTVAVGPETNRTSSLLSKIRFVASGSLNSTDQAITNATSTELADNSESLEQTLISDTPASLKNGSSFEYFTSFTTPAYWSLDTTSAHSEGSAADPHMEYDDTLDIIMPLLVGLLVAIILGWMLMRYKMSAHQRSNYNGSIYCCPEECFNFCSRFLECQFRDPERIKTKNRRDMNKNSMEYQNPHELLGLANNSIKRPTRNPPSPQAPKNARLLSVAEGENNFSFITAGLKMSLAAALPTAGAYEKSMANAASNAPASAAPARSKSIKFQTPVTNSYSSTISSQMTSPSSSCSSSFRIPQIITTSEPANDSASTYNPAEELPGAVDDRKLHSSLKGSRNSSNRLSQSSSNASMSNESTVGPMIPFRFLQRDSLASASSSRRSSNIQLPDLLRSNNFSNLYHSFQSRNSTFVG